MSDCTARIHMTSHYNARTRLIQFSISLQLKISAIIMMRAYLTQLCQIWPGILTCVGPFDKSVFTLGLPNEGQTY